MIKRNLLLYLLFAGLISSGLMAYTQSDCDKCEVYIDSLEHPVPMTGVWKFTTTDIPFNALPEDVHKDWVYIKTPGAWKGVKGKGVNFKVGWYKTKLKFSEDLIGTRVTFLIDTYISDFEFYLDGKSIFKRSEGESFRSYYSIRPIPVEFTVTSIEHTVAFRIETYLMRGVYQLPFQIREKKPFDLTTLFTELWTNDIKAFGSTILTIFGIFFLIVYKRTKQEIYLITGIIGVVSYPYFSVPTDFFYKMFHSYNVLLTHYYGFITISFSTNIFAQMVNGKINKKFVTVLGISQTLLAVLITSLYFIDSVDLFQIMRKLVFISCGLTSVHTVYKSYQFSKTKQTGSRILFYSFLTYFMTTTHDIFLATDVIVSRALAPTGGLFYIVSIIYYTIYIYSDTYRRNDELVGELTNMTQSLEQAVQDTTAELEETNKLLHQTGQTAGMYQLANGILHDIANVLTTTLALAKRIISLVNHEDTRSPYKEKLSIHTSKLYNSLKIVADIIKSQQNYAKTKVESERIPVEQLIQDIIDLNSTFISNEAVKVHLDLTPNLSPWCHKNKLFQVLLNLFKNSIEALKENAIDNREVWISTYESGDFCVIKIKDNGIGISKENLEKMFTHGFTTKKTGHGFGLHASFNSIKEMGGEMKVESNGEGEGAAFYLQLSMVAKKNEEAA